MRTLSLDRPKCVCSYATHVNTRSAFALQENTVRGLGQGAPFGPMGTQRASIRVRVGFIFRGKSDTCTMRGCDGVWGSNIHLTESEKNKSFTLVFCVHCVGVLKFGCDAVELRTTFVGYR